MWRYRGYWEVSRVNRGSPSVAGRRSRPPWKRASVLPPRGGRAKEEAGTEGRDAGAGLRRSLAGLGFSREQQAGVVASPDVASKSQKHQRWREGFVAGNRAD
ncbi:hypothetical protein BHE74_00046513 [Ensete ventricosum]|nr:hypothetical protein BHE74_00046513 [Ensete ventricosum]